jgi:hypothetical protein
MTEQEWLDCTYPGKMREFLRGKVSDRKLRLFALACNRRIWSLITDPRSRKAVEAIELYVENLIGEEDYQRAIEPALAAEEAESAATRAAHYAATAARSANADQAARAAARWAADAVAEHIVEQSQHEDETVYAEADRAGDVEEREQCGLLRDILGNPFRPSPPLPPAVLSWNDLTVPRIAEAIYEERRMPEGTLDNGRLAVLADALEEAGCTNPDILSHCRSGGEHVRGCWVVDLLLGKS